ncbi:FAD-binding oxidoreductase [Flagellatimonas centrodinii]|uniref:FAD-binding oxidoreductase n=1 Tax=Flagellatimonas centrodinii TaxID=2806210 RepID=UPI001FED3367|nr:2Fe-2S iron-sulfur cluster-binding protein [Flagellatimonas centrodinii]ULQ47697.1 FAD-binding oxidoreductase [Flagellatimonas centrodinii]
MFTITLSDGRTFSAKPEHTVLASARAAHVVLPYGCESGSCGACRLPGRGTVAYPGGAPALSAAEAAAGQMLTCRAQPRSDLTLDLPARLAGLAPRRITTRLLARRWLSADVLGVSLKLPRGAPFRYLPGQYVDVLLDDGGRRSFSLASAPDGETLQWHVRVVPGGRFAQALAAAPDGQIIRLEGPLGSFFVRDDDRPLLMVAGGTGLAPVLAQLEALLAEGDPRPIDLWWGVRSEADLYHHEALSGLAMQHANLRYHPVLGAPGAGWTGARGFVHEAVVAAHPDLSAYAVYMAGPPPMIDAAKTAFPAAGLDAAQLFYDRFEDAFKTWPGR